MYCLIQLPHEYDSLNAKLREHAQELVSQLTPDEVNKVVSRQTELGKGSATKKLYRLCEGTMAYMRNGQVLFFYEEGDIMGFEQSFSDQAAQVISDFAVKVDVYDLDKFLSTIHASQKLLSNWYSYLACQTSLISIILSTLTRKEVLTEPEVRAYNKGDTIIKQDTLGTDVFTLLEGKADVYVDDVHVGEILQDEIFGALATLTKSARSASVVASERSLALVVSADKFLELIESRPTTILKLVQDMARAIVSLNKGVVDLSTRKM